jgi:ribosomal protein L11 methyltransferase
MIAPSTTITLHASTSFGNGTHPSTMLVVELLHDLHSQGFQAEKSLDIGCGTGILSIIAAKLFTCEVLAADISKPALQETFKNAQLNDVSHLIDTVHSDTFSHNHITNNAPYDLILFNILAQAAFEHANDAARVMATGALIIISGVLQWQSPAIIEAYAACGLALFGRASSENWECLIFIKTSLP